MKTAITPITAALIKSASSLKAGQLEAAKTFHAKASSQYYEKGKSFLTDREFDRLEELIRKADPKWKPPVGAPVTNKKVERKLVVPCASLSKIKHDAPKILERYLAEFRGGERFRIEAKIDGASLLGHYINGELKSLTTRGDGIRGKSIDGYIKAAERQRSKNNLSGLVTRLPFRGEDFALRFEAAMKTRIYEKHYADEFDSARVVSSAAFNRKVPDEVLVRNIDYVLTEGWRLQGSKMRAMSSDELDVLAARCNIPRPQYRIFLMRDIAPDSLAKVLEDFRKENIYDLDGLVLRPSSFHLQEPLATGENPKYVKAFKVNEEENAPETVIEEIIWNTSSFGVLVPKARVKPVMFGNVEVQHAALHNVEWAETMGAGVGARVKIIRSGEIIPKIVEVVKKVKFQLPDPRKVGFYERQGKKLVLKSSESFEVRVKKIARMFSTLKLDSLGSGLADRMVAHGFDSTAKVALMTQEDLAELPKVKTVAQKYAAEIARIRSGEFTVPQLFLASGVADAGLGESWMKKLSHSCPEVFSSKVKSQNVLAISKVIGPAAASNFALAWPAFCEWMREVKPKVAPIPAKQDKKVKHGALSGQCFSWTGYRSKEEEAWIESQGGEVVPFGKRTTVLFFRPDGKRSTKVDKAGDKAQVFSAWKKSL